MPKEINEEGPMEAIPEQEVPMLHEVIMAEAESEIPQLRLYRALMRDYEENPLKLEVMPTTVWSHNTTVCIATNFTPFRLMYGAKAILLEEIKHHSLRTAIEIVPCPNEVEEKDMLELDRLKAMVSLEKYPEQTRVWRDTKVKLREFDLGNLVLL
jgi:hypothetical protein